MLQPVFDFLERLITEFTWRRLALVTLLLVSTVTGFILYELYTGHFTLGKLTESAELLDTLTEQHEQVTKTGDKNLIAIHESLTNSLKEQNDGITLVFNMPEWSLKALAALAPWMLVIILAMLSDPNGIWNMLGGFVIFVTPVLIIAALLPTWQPWWINYILIPFALCVVPGFFLALYGNRKKT